MTTPTQTDVVVVGAGFGGLYMLHKLRQLGYDAHVIEAGGGVGGTWYWNRYPGARCDIESIQYSYSFDDALQQEWDWTERYATQPEILRYAEHVADRFDLRRSITLNTRVTGADLDVDGAGWTVRTDSGAEVHCRFLIAAVGCLSTAQIPDWPGLDSYRGETFHTGSWPHEGVDFTGKRVGVIGTGSSGIQIIPMLAQDAAHLTVFQRTPTYSFPARNRMLAADELAGLKARYPEIRRDAKLSPVGRQFRTEGRSMFDDAPDQIQKVLHTYWEYGGLDITRAYTDIGSDPAATEVVSDFVRERIAEVLDDPALGQALTPRTYQVNSRRPTLDSHYFQTYNRPNVDLVDVAADPIVGLTETGLRTERATYELDAIVFATGFDAMTGSLIRLNVRGRDGLALADAWADGPATYLGLAVHGFPNFFTITGPGSPSVLSNVIMAIEQHVEWLGDLLAHAQEAGLSVIEAEARAQAEWTRHNNELGANSPLAKTGSWYVGSNIPGKPVVVMPYVGGTNVYRDICDEVAADSYRGFLLS